MIIIHDDTKQAIRLLLEHGWGVVRAATATGVHHTTIWSYCRQWGINGTGKPRGSARPVLAAPGVSVTTDERGRPAEVVIGGMRLGAEVVEKLAARLEAMRGLAGDGRWCCVKHGYHERPDCEFCERET